MTTGFHTSTHALFHIAHPKPRPTRRVFFKQRKKNKKELEKFIIYLRHNISSEKFQIKGGFRAVLEEEKPKVSLETAAVNQGEKEEAFLRHQEWLEAPSPPTAYPRDGHITTDCKS